MISIGFDERGHEHFVPDGEEDRHALDTLCGCNPDPGNDENPYSMSQEKIKWFWLHDHLDGYSPRSPGSINKDLVS